MTHHLGVDGVLGHKGRERTLPVDRTLLWSGGSVLVRLLHGGPPKVAWFARTTPIAKTWDVIYNAARQGGRVLLWPAGKEVALDAKLGEIIHGNQLTLALWWPGVGGGAKEDQELLDASKHGHVGEVEAALGRGANVNVTGIWNRTPLHRAAFYGRVEVAQVLLAAGADPNAGDTSGDIPLHCSALNGCVEMVQVFFAAGVDVNAKNKHGRTSLHSAALSGHVEVAQILLAAGADLNAGDSRGETPLDLAKRKGHSTFVVLLQHGVPPLLF